MTDVVVFVDALSPRELSGVFEDWHQGEMDAGVPRVTPRVMSSIYTGLDPAENGMLEVSRYGGEQTTRPKKSTIIDRAVRAGRSVLSMGMPFCVPFQVDVEDVVGGGGGSGDSGGGGGGAGGGGRGGNGDLHSLLNGDALQGARQTIPPGAENLVSVPAPQADMIRSHPDRVYASFRDQTVAYFNRFKEAIRYVDPDVAFLGYRLVDSYCHFQHTETRRGKPYRQHLIDELADLLGEIAAQIDGDVLFFSDHGQTELTDVFRVNRWLKEAGWLDYKVDYDFVGTFEDWQHGEKHPVEARVEHQITFGRPGVTLDEAESQVVCADPFDSCLTLLCDREEFDAEAFREDLLSTGMYRSVDYKWELYDETADFYDDVPDVIPDRAEGVFVSGNLHEQPIGMGYYRSGVHDRTACFGATRPLSIPDGTVTPEDMHDVLASFVGLGEPTAPLDREAVRQFTTGELQRQRDVIDQQLAPASAVEADLGGED